MKATIDLPDELYRRVKARSALEGRPLRSVALQLFQNWLEAPRPGEGVLTTRPELSRAERAAAPWLSIARRYVQPGRSHDMDEIRAAMAAGWASEIAEKLTAPGS